MSYAISLGLQEPAADKLADIAQFGLPRGYLSIGSSLVSKLLTELKPGVETHEAFERATGKPYGERRPGTLIEELPYYGVVLQGRVSPGTSDPSHDDERRYGQLGNITVHIALNEIRKIVNKLLRRYGHPRRIVIETTRELKANTKRLREIEDEQAKREAENRRLEDEIKEDVERTRSTARGDAFLARAATSRKERLRRIRLAKRQGNLCIYTGNPIRRADLFTNDYQIDHIIPLTRNGTFVEDNLVVCEAGANAAKLNRTPYEAWHDTPRWKDIEAAAKKLPSQMHWRFTADAAKQSEEQDEGWAPRQIRDTSYIARAAMEYLAHVCIEVAATKGALTAYLRAAWQLPKSRHDNRHHFVDAAVIALTDRSVVQHVNTLHARGALPRATESGIDPLYEGFPLELARLYDRIWPSLRPDRSVRGVNGELHAELLFGSVKDRDGKVRLTRRRSPDDLFRNGAKLVSDDDAREAIESFVSDRFRERFQGQIEKCKRLLGDAPLAQLAILAASDPHWGPRGIGEIKCFEDQKPRDPESLRTVPRGDAEHRPIVNTNSNAWLEIRPHQGRWKGAVTSTFDAANRVRSAQGATKDSPAKTVMILRRRDIVAWDNGGKREIGYVKVIKTTGQFFVWPLRLAESMEAAGSRPDLKIPTRDGISFAAESFRKARGCLATVSILGRLRDPRR